MGEQVGKTTVERFEGLAIICECGSKTFVRMEERKDHEWGRMSDIMLRQEGKGFSSTPSERWGPPEKPWRLQIEELEEPESPWGGLSKTADKNEGIPPLTRQQKTEEGQPWGSLGQIADAGIARLRAIRQRDREEEEEAAQAVAPDPPNA